VGNIDYSAAPEADQSFSVAAGSLAITSTDGTTATVGTHFSFTVTTTGASRPAITKKGKLPGHVTFVNNHDGTATISGKPTTAGVYNITITAAIGKGKNRIHVSQAFTLTVDPAA
jgi:hypothetical protein